MALNRSDKSRILRRYFPGMTRNSEMSTEPSAFVCYGNPLAARVMVQVGLISGWNAHHSQDQHNENRTQATVQIHLNPHN